MSESLPPKMKNNEGSMRPLKNKSKFGRDERIGRSACKVSKFNHGTDMKSQMKSILEGGGI